MNIFKLSCSCGKHDFIFGEKPNRKIEVICPECGVLNTYDPKERPKKAKEDEK